MYAQRRHELLIVTHYGSTSNNTLHNSSVVALSLFMSREPSTTAKSYQMLCTG